MVMGVILTPFRAGAAALTHQAERFYNYLYGYEKLEAENRVLQQRVAELEQAGNQAAEYQRENERLKELLNLTQEHEDYKLVPGQPDGRPTAAPGAASSPSARAAMPVSRWAWWR